MKGIEPKYAPEKDMPLIIRKITKKSPAKVLLPSAVI